MESSASSASALVSSSRDGVWVVFAGAGAASIGVAGTEAKALCFLKGSVAPLAVRYFRGGLLWRSPVGVGGGGVTELLMTA